MTSEYRNEWESYRDAEYARLMPLVREFGYTLDETQVHTKGERYLQSGWKLVLTGATNDGVRVIVKASSHPSGIAELVREHERRRVLHTLDFAYLPFHTPKELCFVRRGGMTFSVTEFIEQESSFLERTLADQFFLALGAFKEQEGVHATTASHARAIRNVFGMKGAHEYITTFNTYREAAHHTSVSPRLDAMLERSSRFLNEHVEVIDGYAGFLTHEDFVPHNFRVRDGVLYLLDYTSLAFGNKYESWARFANYMTLYHGELQRSLDTYLRANRSELEYVSYRLMRVYKLGFLISFYAGNLDRSTGDLRALSEERIRFWTGVAESVLDDTEVTDDFVAEYRNKRDALRSEDEKERQRELGQL